MGRGMVNSKIMLTGVFRFYQSFLIIVKNCEDSIR